MRPVVSFTGKEVNAEDEIIIYGAGVYGEIAYYGLHHMGLYPKYFCDHNTAGRNAVHGIPFISPSELKLHKKAKIIIASYNYFYEMLDICERNGCESCFDMEYILQLRLEKYPLSGRALGCLKDVSGYQSMLTHSQSKGKLNINHVDFVILENCSLRCKACANLIPHYRHPEILDADECLMALKKFLDVMDYVGEVYLLGGEPFLHPDIGKIIDGVAAQPKVGGNTVFTNGTIIPSERVLKTMHERRTVVHISDYHLPKQRIDELINVLKRYNVEHVVKAYDTWIDLGDIVKKNYTKGEVAEHFQQCFFRKQYTLHRGKLYLCPRAAHGTYLRLFDSIDNEVVDFSKKDVRDEKELRILAHNLLYRKEPIHACEYCNGGNLRNRPIPAAEQKEAR